MTGRVEMLVKVKDPSGKLFEVTRRNALDLVQNLGWTLEGVDQPMLDVLATAPRNVKPRTPRGAPLPISTGASEEAAEVAETPAKRGRGRPPKAAKVEEVEVEEVIETSVEDDDLAALEAEEALRGERSEDSTD
jgi:hypothetical protein